MDSNERLRNTDLDMNNAQRLRQLIKQLTAGVIITEKDAELREIQELQRQKLLEDIGVLLIYVAPDQTANTIWDLLKPHLLKELLEDQGQKLNHQHQLSKPLTGQPSEVLKMTGFSQQGHPFNKIVDNLRRTMTPQQQQILPQVTGRLV